MDKGRQHVAGQEQLKGDRTGRIEFPHQPGRPAHMHQPGLHPAFIPARALPEPRPESRRRLLIGRRRQGRRAIAEAIEPNAQIGVFGDVIGVPAADLAQHGRTEMVRRAAKRKRQVQRRQAGQESIELAGVSSREHARQPAVRGVVDRQRRLHAGEPCIGRHERIDGAPQLIGFRHILGVVDDRERAASEWQRDVERLRFGPRPVERRRDQAT